MTMNKDQIKGATNAEVSGAVDRSISATTHALETTREFTGQAMERAGEKVRDVREGLKDASVAAQEQLNRYARRTTRYVSERPVASALIAAAAGAAVAALALAVLRKKRRQS